MANKQKFYGWTLAVVTAMLYLINMGMPLYAGAVISSHMLKEIVMPRSVYGLGFTLLNLFIGLSAIAIAPSIAKWGTRITFVIGSALICIGALFMSFYATLPWHYLLGLGVIIGSGIGFGSVIPCTTIVARWFSRFRGRVMALVFGSGALGGLLFAPAANKVIEAYSGGWRLGWLLIAGIMVGTALLAYFFVKENPQDLGQEPDGGAPKDADQKSGNAGKVLFTKHDWTPSEAYKTVQFWLIFIATNGCQFPFFFFVAHWMLVMLGSGFSPATAAFSMGVFTAMGIPAKAIGGWLMDKIDARYVFMIGFLCYMIAFALATMINVHNLILVYVVVSVMTMGFSLTFLCANTITANFFGPKAFPKLNGTNMLLSGIVCSPAGIVAGYLFDIFKSYTVALELNVVISFIALVAAYFLKMPKPKSASTELKETTSI